MTKFIMGLLLGLILGIGGTAAFLITAQGGDYLVATSPRVRELEATLKQGDSERDWLRHQLRESSDALAKLESRFVGLSERFERLGAGAGAGTVAGGSVGHGSVAGGSVAGGSGSDGSVADGSGADGSVAGGAVAGDPVDDGAVPEADGAPSAAPEPTPEGPAAAR